MSLDMLAALLILLALGDIVVTIVLVRAARRLSEPALEERATASVILTFAAVLTAILSAVYLLDIALPSPYGTLMLAFGLMLVSLPQFVWVVAYWRGAFR